MKRDVRLFGDPVLRQKAEKISEITPELRRLIADMFDTMYAEEGVGLAAPQVGVGQRVIVVDPRLDEVKPFALVNPEIVELSEDTDRDEEGCLSLPGLKDVVERPARVVVAGTNVDGEAQRIDASGLLARVLQHEVDHLDGVLFIDRVSPLKRKMMLKKWEKTRPERARG
jgi:peptide deformylase